MIIFAMESSCDETAAAVVRAEGGRFEVLSDIVSSQIPIHALYGGVVPEIASRAHCEAVSGVARQAVEQAGTAISALISCGGIRSSNKLVPAIQTTSCVKIIPC